MRDDLPSTSELLEGVSFFPIALVVSATIFPGLTLCIPGLILAAAMILLPLAALAIVAAVVAAVLAAPVFAVRGIRRLVHSKQPSSSCSSASRS
jgi:hypothetical protein